MKNAIKLAYRNLLGAGLRTGLNVGLLAFVFIVILLYKGILEGWNQQAVRANVDWEYADGQLRYSTYDPVDPFTIKEGHGFVPPAFAKKNTPVLIQQATVYPKGRMYPVLLKGIAAEQQALKLPTQAFGEVSEQIPAIIGKRMADALQLNKGDNILLRWRDHNGTFDAESITIVDVFDTDVTTIDNGQIWIPIEKMWAMTGLKNEATYLIMNDPVAPLANDEWVYYSQDELLSDLYAVLDVEETSASFLYLILLSIALLALFDTQVLSIFRRQKEIGTYIALGMTREKVVELFTIEGTMYSLLSIIIGGLVGAPIMYYTHTVGLAFPKGTQEMGITIGDIIYPTYSLGLISQTILMIVASAAIVSYIPARKIAKLDPVNALKGKIQ